MHLSGYEPMLAGSGRIDDPTRYGYQAKLDGWRAVLHVGEDGLRVLSRPGRDLTTSLPELAPIVDAVPAGTVLDGELVAGSGSAWSFYRVGPLVASRPERRQVPLTFAAFDVLACEGRRVVDRPFEDRTALLTGLAFRGSSWCTVATWGGVSIADMLAVCEGRGAEGLVGKRLDSRYFPGQRRPEWVKIKTAHWRAVHAERRHDRAAR